MIPNRGLLAVTWSDVGGYEDVKSRLRQALEWPIKHTAAFKRLGLLAPRGILLYGPPGKHHTLPSCVLCQPSAFAACNDLPCILLLLPSPMLIVVFQHAKETLLNL